METGPPRRTAWSLVALLGGTGATLLAILGHAARAGAVQEGLLVPAVEALAVGRVELGRGIALVAGSGVRAVRLPLLVDDPLVHIDADRAAEIWGVLCAIARERQVILTTQDRLVLEHAVRQHT